MTKITRQKIYDFNHITAVYCNLAVSVLAEIYHTKYGCKPKIKHIEAVIENNVSYPHQLLSSKRLQRFIFTTEQERFEIQLVDGNNQHLFIRSHHLFNIACAIKTKADFIISDIEHIKSDIDFKEICLAKVLDKIKTHKISGGIMPASLTTANQNLLWQPVDIIFSK